VVTVCRPDWAHTVIDVDPKFLGLLPCSAIIIEKDDKVMVGAGTPTLLGQVVYTEKIQQLVEAAEAAIRSMVENAAGVEPLKSKQIILYSSHTCPFCVMEKTWLDQQKTPYNLIYVEDDQKAAISLVQRSGQTSVPMTEVVYDNDETEFIVGFDRAKLEKIVSAI
jgi:glutaredoxin 3